ncbi:arsenate reductase ArsC [Terasakiella sp. A23]|uniref:arsenate reductase ArsC n=1 Tax=Terasakiella sp. FCG-A23 TaxID=3080561 RepID=UPI00295340FB|nr:arsenate reductase ArsC [Terasakiella sp. A23]MDV7339843.1 arsenate reductase ArsC [Terasakiella sp. A23]
MSDKPLNVLFLCKHNTARSIIAEALLNRLGQGRFKAFSAGSNPSKDIHPYTVDLMKNMNYGLDGQAPKAMDTITEEMDFIFTVCDETSVEDCPAFNGEPMTANWEVPDPIKAEGTEAEKRLAFSEAYRMLNNRISIFVNLPLTEDRAKLQGQLNDIGT